MRKFFIEFKEFAVQGNIVDLAVAVVIGTAFKAIVTSLVQDIIMPFFAAISGKANFRDLNFVIGTSQINYGNFIQNVVDFFIIAITIFIILRSFMKLKILKKEEQEESQEKVEPRLCPYCKEEVAKDASKCPHCTADI